MRVPAHVPDRLTVGLVMHLRGCAQRCCQIRSDKYYIKMIPKPEPAPAPAPQEHAHAQGGHDAHAHPGGVEEVHEHVAAAAPAQPLRNVEQAEQISKLDSALGDSDVEGMVEGKMRG